MPNVGPFHNSDFFRNGALIKNLNDSLACDDVFNYQLSKKCVLNKLEHKGVCPGSSNVLDYLIYNLKHFEPCITIFSRFSRLSVVLYYFELFLHDIAPFWFILVHFEPLLALLSNFNTFSQLFNHFTQRCITLINFHFRSSFGTIFHVLTIVNNFEPV